MLSRYCLAAALFIVFGISSFAQQQQEHVKRTYIDERDQLFIQKDLPVYLKVSTSADDTGENILLMSKKSANYTNPLYLDSEGLNTIRTPYAVDQNTRKTVQPLQDIVFEVYADGVAPTSRVEFNGAEKHVSNGRTYYGPDLRVSIFAKDGVSGVEDTYFSLDGSEYASYQQMILMDQEGPHELKYYSADNVGNAERSQFRNFIVDITPPESTYEIVGPGSSDALSPKTVISLSSTDNLSGVKHIKYFIDDGQTKTYTKPIPFSTLTDGNHKFTFYAVDNVGNIEDHHDDGSSYEFYIDKIAPKVTANVIGDLYDDGETKWVSPRSEVELTAEDQKSGVADIQYTLDQSGHSKYVSPFKLPNRYELHSVFYFAQDEVQNRSQNFVLPLYMDNINPVTSVKIGDPQFFARDTLFINKKALLTLTAKDKESGLQKIIYKIDEGAEEVYSSPVMIADEGFHKVKFWSLDNVNNTEEEKETEFFVDMTGPQVFVNFSIKAIGEKKGILVYPNYTRMYIGATDEKCGTSDIKYSINGGPMQDYSSPYSLDVSEKNVFKANTLYEVDIVATDKLGNETKEKVRFYVGQANN